MMAIVWIATKDKLLNHFQSRYEIHLKVVEQAHYPKKSTEKDVGDVSGRFY